MSSTILRDRVFDVARRDIKSAQKLADSIQDPWFRAQALAAISFFGPENRVEVVASQALASARACADDYQRAGAAAWAVHALTERGKSGRAHSSVEWARGCALRAAPPGSRSEALLLLLQAAWNLDSAIRIRLTTDLMEVDRSGASWRSSRAIVDALSMLANVAPTPARTLAASISNERLRLKAITSIEAPVHISPRQFFA